MTEPEGHEGIPELPQERVYEPTVAELQNGYELESDQTVALEMPPNPTMGNIEIEVSEGLKVQGKPVAEVRVGGVNEASHGTVLETDAKGSLDAPEREYSIVFNDTVDGKPIIAKLEKGQIRGIGRKYEGQGNFPKTVSGDHCAVGLDEQGRLLVINHKPTNYTSVRRFGTPYYKALPGKARTKVSELLRDELLKN